MSVYTDIADEIYGPSKGQVPGGVKLFTARSGPITLTRVQITRAGLARPAGRYSTLEMPSLAVADTKDERYVSAVAGELRAMLPETGSVLVVGVGNRRVTADALGPLTEEERLCYTWTLQSHIDIAKAVWLDYCTGQMLDSIAREPLWQHLINYRCGTGHSVSFVGNVHEGPHSLNPRNQVVFEPGMVITDEPGVYEGSRLGIRIENELECREKTVNQYGRFLCFEPLTWVPIATSPIVPGVLTRDQLDWLNAYHRRVFEQLAPRLTGEERDWLARKCAAIGA